MADLQAADRAGASLALLQRFSRWCRRRINISRYQRCDEMLARLISRRHWEFQFKATYLIRRWRLPPIRNKLNEFDESALQLARIVAGVL